MRYKDKLHFLHTGEWKRHDIAKNKNINIGNSISDLNYVYEFTVVLKTKCQRS